MGTVFVAGTEIGVGKTVVAGALVHAAIAAGARPAFIKPFVTDDREDMYAVLLASMGAMGRPAKGVAVAPAVCTADYTFNSQASPYAGMSGSGEGVDVGAVLGTISEMCGDTGTVIVEGSGGVMTPIRRGYHMADLMADAAMSPIVVTTNRIGALGLAAMSAEACKERRAPPIGFVVNCIDPGGYEPDRIAGDIRDVTGAPVLAVLGMHGERPAQGRKGSLFGSLPPKEGAGGMIEGGFLGERMPEGVKRSAAASGAIHEGGLLKGIADVLLAEEDRRAQEVRDSAIERRRWRLVPAAGGGRGGAGAQKGGRRKRKKRGSGAP